MSAVGHMGVSFKLKLVFLEAAGVSMLFLSEVNEHLGRKEGEEGGGRGMRERGGRGEREKGEGEGRASGKEGRRGMVGNLMGEQGMKRDASENKL